MVCVDSLEQLIATPVRAAPQMIGIEVLVFFEQLGFIFDTTSEQHCVSHRSDRLGLWHLVNNLVHRQVIDS
jgi:hypothetical protein